MEKCNFLKNSRYFDYVENIRFLKFDFIKRT